MAQAHVLGVDFGTSNSAAGYLHDGQPRLVEITPGAQTLPTTFFFDFESRKTLMGAPANQALIDGLDGRFMRALKRVLGTSLMHEKRQILNERVTFVEIIARFLSHIKSRAEATSGLTFDHALSGRPVVFRGTGDAREAQAQEDLRACYLAAGLHSVDFMAEPEAAAVASGALDARPQIGLIVDIGGGTSDFSLFESGDGVRILANHGVRIGGTDFDRAINIAEVMPLLGKGSQLRKDIGPGTLVAPNAIFNDLATWEKIPFLYTAQTRRMVQDMHSLAEAPANLARLNTVITDELGHDLAFAVEQGKIAANSGAEEARIDLSVVEQALAAPLVAAELPAILSTYDQALRDGAEETLRLAGVPRDQVAQIVYVGGSSLMSLVPTAMKSVFPGAEHRFSEVFTAVADGLAIAAGRQIS